MVIIYEPSAKELKNRAKKYLKANNQNVGIFRSIILTLGFLSLKNKIRKRKIELLEGCILVNYFGEKEFIIRYKAIKEIVIDEEDIIIINEVKPLLIAKNAFLDAYQRELFIEKLNCYYEIEKIELTKEIYNANNAEILTYDREYKKETFLALYNLNKFDFVAYKKYEYITPIVRKARNFLLIIFINMILASLGFYFMGAFSKNIENGIIIFLGVITAAHLVGNYMIPKLKLISKINNQIQEGKIRLKFAISNGRLYIDDENGKHIYNINQIKNIRQIKKGILISILETSNQMKSFLMPYTSEYNIMQGKEFISIIANMQEINDYKFDKDKKRKKISLEKIISILNKLFIIVAIIIIPSIFYISKNYFPNYYHKAQVQKEQWEKESTMAFLEHYGQNFYNTNYSNDVESSSSNQNDALESINNTSTNSIKENYPIDNLFTNQCDYQNTNVQAKASILGAYNAWGYSTFTYQLESNMTQAQGYEIINKNSNIQIPVTCSAWVIERLFMVQADLVSNNIGLAEKELISLTPYIKQIKNTMLAQTLTGIQERIFTQYLQLAMAPDSYSKQYNESLNELVAINSEMPQSATINYVKESLGAGDYINVGPVCVDSNNMLYRIVFMNGQGSNQDVYTISIVYENGTSKIISQFTMNQNDYRLNY